MGRLIGPWGAMSAAGGLYAAIGPFFQGVWLQALRRPCPVPAGPVGIKHSPLPSPSRRGNGRRKTTRWRSQEAICLADCPSPRPLLPHRCTHTHKHTRTNTCRPSLEPARKQSQGTDAAQGQWHTGAGLHGACRCRCCRLRRAVVPKPLEISDRPGQVRSTSPERADQFAANSTLAAAGAAARRPRRGQKTCHASLRGRKNHAQNELRKREKADKCVMKNRALLKVHTVRWCCVVWIGATLSICGVFSPRRSAR